MTKNVHINVQKSKELNKKSQIQKKLPQKTGVYLFLNDKNEAIYIGKAKNLRKRTAYYFKEDALPKRLSRMTANAVDLKYFITETENDAFLLEAQLIKERKPIYNVLYKHGRSLYYINFTKGHFPRLEIINEWSEGAIGPFLSMDYVKNLLKELLAIFKIRTCTDYVFTQRKRPCLEFFASRCSAPCVQKISEEEYNKTVQELISFLQGNTKTILQQWHKEMQNAVHAENYELAAKKRDQINAAEQLKQKQNIYFEDILRLDIVAHHKNYFYIESICRGAINNIEYRKYNKTISLEEFLWEFYPDEPVFRVIGPQANTPFKSYSHKMNKLEKRIYANTTIRMQSLIKEEKNKEAWKLILGLVELDGIEVYDSSHYAGQYARCGMVYYKGDKFIKSRYRTWKASSDSRNDLEILAQALTRRQSLGNLPSMILLDGGIAQLNVAKEILAPYTAIFAFAKGERRRGGTLYGINGPIAIDSELMLFLEKLRDEAHRWAHKNTSLAFAKKFKKQVSKKIMER